MILFNIKFYIKLCIVHLNFTPADSTHPYRNSNYGKGSLHSRTSSRKSTTLVSALNLDDEPDEPPEPPIRCKVNIRFGIVTTVRKLFLAPPVRTNLPPWILHTCAIVGIDLATFTAHYQFF